jgi:major membrane immunogen (membrane-anchored lipoprotein)
MGRINSNHADERQAAVQKMQEAHDEVVQKMNGNMGDVVTEMTLSRAEAVKAAQDEASQRRQGLVHQNQVLSKEVLRLRECEFRNVNIRAF